MTHWTWWQSGLALAGVAFFHWLWTRRLLAVSGAMTSLVNRVRFGAEEDPGLSMEEMVAAVQAATAREFGDVALEAPPRAPPTVGRTLLVTTPRSPSTHALLLFGLAAGGALSALSAGTFTVTPTLVSSLFTRLTGGSPVLGPVVLLASGVLVGFGTRMAGGCTSGHGLSGVSRGESGSLAATATFFGAGVLVSFLLGRLL